MAIKTYDVNYYVTSKEEIENSGSFIQNLKKSAYNAVTLAEVTLAEKAYMIDKNLFKVGVDKFMYRRELDEYVSNPSNGVKLRKLEEYNRLIPPELATPVSYIQSVGGQVLVLSFNEENIDASPSKVISNSLLSDSKVRNKVIGSVQVTDKPAPRPVSTSRRYIDPILFGTITLGGRMWEKVWILGAWLNAFPTISTSESIIACLNSMFSKGESEKFRVDERLLNEE